uniref:histone deacetylase n=1 Tax=Achlya hypogyna TaxID=1202772 RepID=A0A0A7CN60_ACHHY|nr:secreted protein [Achlya hypogyna]
MAVASPVALVFSSAYALAASQLPVHQDRECMTFSLLQHLGLLGNMHVVAPTPATVADLSWFHSSRYIAALQTAEALSRDEELEFGLTDDAYVFPRLFEYCTYVAGASITAAALLSGADRRVDVAIHWGGGRHHAMKDRASGFCYVNDVVLAVETLLRKSPDAKVVVFDIDIHHGDGVESAFYYSSRVFTVSFHKFARGFFPNSGAPTRIGAGPGKYWNLNVPLDDGITDEQYAPAMESWRSYQPSDPLGTFNLTATGIGWCLQVLQEMDKPLLLLGGGGYNAADAARTFAHLTATILGVDESYTSAIPEHDFYDRYGPHFTMKTTASVARRNKNTVASLEATCKEALRHLDRAEEATSSS